MPDRKTVMISSTARDLSEHRQAAVDACLRQGMFPVMLEHRPASDAKAVEASLKLVEGADLYLGILGHRSGEVPEGRDLSIAEMEYNRAVERGKPCLLFVLEDAESGEGADRLQRFKERALTQGEGRTYKSPADLRAQALDRLSEHRVGDLPSRAQADRFGRDYRNRQAMLAQVRHAWIEGVLEKPLYREARIERGLEAQLPAVPPPRALVVHEQDPDPTQFPHGPRLIDLLDDLDGGVLVRGGPGSGKTTLLLEWTADLLDRAGRGPEHPIPIVLTLSSWAVECKPLAEWLVDELHVQYNVPRKVGQAWVEHKAVLPLLDGLDEVAAAHRDACARAIRAFRDENEGLPLAVCCRTQAHEALEARLDLACTVTLQPLACAQVDRYLEKAGPALAGVRDVLRSDEGLYALLDSPLMLSVAALAYTGRAVSGIRTTEPVEEQRKCLFTEYVQAMHGRREVKGRYQPAQAERWLSWLAWQMRAHGQSVFLVERMQADWLPKKRHRWLVRWGAAALGGLAAWLLVWLGIWLAIWPFAYVLLDAVPPSAGLNVGLAAGLIFGLAGGLVRKPIVPAAARGWSWRKAARGLAIGLILGLVGASIGWLAGMLASALVGGGDKALIASQAGQRAVLATGWMTILLAQGLATWLVTLKSGMRGSALAGALVGCLAGVPLFQPALNDVERGLLNFCCGPTVGLLFGLSGALAGGLVGGVVADEVPRPSAGHSGIRGLARAALTSGLLAGSVVGPVAGLALWVGLWLTSGSPKLALYGLFLVLPFGLAFGVLAGLIAALGTGGLAWLRHLVLRVLLVRTDLAPWNRLRFLDDAAERALLRPVGGGYLFAHPLLQDHFAKLWEREDGEGDHTG